MTLITDPDKIANSSAPSELTVDTTNKTIGLALAGNLTNDGVTFQCVYSYLKEEWKDNADFIKFPFPMNAITEEKFEVINGWDFLPVTGAGNDGGLTRRLLRNGGWALKSGSTSLEEYACIVTLGSLDPADQVYYAQTTATNPTINNIVLLGVVNQPVKIYGDITHGNFDYRDCFKIFVREYGRTYGSAQLADIGVTTMTYQVYRFPLADAVDLKIVDSDSTVDSDAPYTSMSIEWFSAAQEKTGLVNGTCNFHVIVTGNEGSAEEIYTFVQRQLRKSSDIDAGAGNLTGQVTPSLLTFVGDTLYTLLYASGKGTFIDDYNTTDVNRLYFTDDTGVIQNFPYTAALTLQFGDNLKNDASATFWVFFTDDNAGNDDGRDYGTADAMLVKNATNVDMSHTIDGASNIVLSYAYDTNAQRGTASAGKEVSITVVAIGLDTAQFVIATGSILRSTTNTVSLVAALERNYKNA